MSVLALTVGLIATLTPGRLAYDGDTFRADLPCDIYAVCKDVPIRIRGIDAPEIRGQCRREKTLALAARDAARAALAEARQIELTNLARGYYGRLVATVTLDGESLGEHLLQQGLARRYDGKRRGWCVVEENP